MGAEKYFMANSFFNGLGDIWLFQVFQAADSSTGKKLLGSVLERNAPFVGERYPIPKQMTEAEVVLKRIYDLRVELDLPDAANPAIDHLRYTDESVLSPA